MEIKINVETAAEDVKRWLDFKNVRPSKRQANASYVNELVESVMYGDITIGDDCKITQTLKAPMLAPDGSTVLDKIVYKPRVMVKEMSACLTGNSNNDMEATIAMGAAISGQPLAYMARLDSCDFAVVTAIVVFFT